MKATIPGRVANTTQLRFLSRQGWFDLQSTGSFWGRDRIPASERGQTRTFLDPDQGVSTAPLAHAVGLRFYSQLQRLCRLRQRNEKSNSRQRTSTPATPQNKAPRPSALQRAGPSSVVPVAVVGAREGRPPQACAANSSRPLRSPPGSRRHVGLRRDTAWPPGRPRTPHRDPAPEGARSRQRGRARVPVSGRAQVAAAPAPRCRPRRERRGGAGGERRRSRE